MRTDTKPVDFLDKIRTPGGGSKAGRFLWHFLGLQVPMGFGALICYLLGRLIPASSSLATAYHPGTVLFAIGDVLYLVVPVVVWMVFRGRGWRHSLEMAMAMSVPVVAIMVLGQLMAYDYLTWLITAGYPLMSLGMLIYMLYQRDYFTERARHSAQGLGSEG
jgi:hypothetical protein